MFSHLLETNLDEWQGQHVDLLEINQAKLSVSWSEIRKMFKKRQFCRQEGRCHSAKWKVKHKTLGRGVCDHVSSMFRVEPTKCIEGITKQKHRGHNQEWWKKLLNGAMLGALIFWDRSQWCIQVMNLLDFQGCTAKNVVVHGPIMRWY
jgi:hypothetical protein